MERQACCCWCANFILFIFVSVCVPTGGLVLHLLTVNYAQHWVELEGEALDLPVDLRSIPNGWLWFLSTDHNTEFVDTVNEASLLGVDWTSWIFFILKGASSGNLDIWDASILSVEVSGIPLEELENVVDSYSSMHMLLKSKIVGWLYANTLPMHRDLHLF